MEKNGTDPHAGKIAAQVSYAGKDAEPPAPRQGRVLAVLVVGAAILMLTTTVRIEILNAQAGGVLPRSEYRDDGGLSKWRVSAATSETTWRRMTRDANGQPIGLDRDLTPAEAARMRREVAEARINNRLRDVVGSWGLIQYPIVAMNLVLSLTLLVGSRERKQFRAIAAPGLVATVVCGGLIVYRGYFSSLGW